VYQRAGNCSQTGGHGREVVDVRGRARVDDAAQIHDQRHQWTLGCRASCVDRKVRVAFTNPTFYMLGFAQGPTNLNIA
jgi:hypothetical protein